jgi:predicted DNA-binding transcriptional regulator AlpA
MELVSTIEIARMLGVSRQRVDQLRTADGFPDPVHVLAIGRIWRATDIAAWAASTGRTVQGASS